MFYGRGAWFYLRPFSFIGIGIGFGIETESFDPDPDPDPDLDSKTSSPITKLMAEVRTNPYLVLISGNLKEPRNTRKRSVLMGRLAPHCIFCDQRLVQRKVSSPVSFSATKYHFFQLSTFPIHHSPSTRGFPFKAIHISQDFRYGPI